MEPKRIPREPAPRHPRRSPRVDELGPPLPTPPPVCVVVIPPRTFIAIDDAMRQRIADATSGVRFVGENRDLAAYAAMTPKENGRRRAAIETRNRTWIDAVFQATGAVWFTVMGGDVVAASHDVNSMPTHAERWEEGRRTGRVPLLFIHPRVTMIDG